MEMIKISKQSLLNLLSDVWEDGRKTERADNFPDVGMQFIPKTFEESDYYKNFGQQTM